MIVADVYPAGESPINGADKESLVSGLQSAGHPDVCSLESADHLAELIAEVTNIGDMVVCLGAGTITHWANTLPAALAHRSASTGVVKSI